MRDFIHMSPDQLVVRFSSVEPVGKPESSDELIRWTATLELPFLDDEPTKPDPNPIILAEAVLYCFDFLDSVSPPADGLDSTSADIAHYQVLFDEDGELSADLSLVSGLRVVIADRVLVDRDWRGRGLGPLLLATALNRLAGVDAFAACIRSPFELPAGHPRWARERARLCRVWARLGFQPFRDGVFVCDMATNTLEMALRDLQMCAGSPSGYPLRLSPGR